MILSLPVRSDTLPMSLNAYVSMCELTTNSPVIHADLSFQSSQRWKIGQKRRFIKSLLNNQAPSVFLIADTLLCSVDEYLTDEDRAYYKEHYDNGVKYLNIDSNNRTTCIGEFMMDGFHMGGRKITLVDDNGMQHTIKPFSYWSDLSDDIKNLFLFSRTISVVKYTRATRNQLSELFENVNEGVSLNSAEKRNCRVSTVANVIRQLALDYFDLFTDKVVTTKVTRRGVDEFIAKMCAVYFYGWDKNISKGLLDQMYDNSNEVNESMNKFSTFFKKYLRTVGVNFSDFGKMSAAYDYFIIMKVLDDEGYSVKKGRENDMFDAWLVAHTELLSSKEVYEWREERYSTYRELGSDLGYRETKLRIELLFDKVDFTEFCIKKDNVRTYSRDDKLIMAVRDNRKTAEGKDIKRGEILNHAGGHVVPHSYGIEEGGVTTLENGVLQTHEDNRKLGANPVVVE